MCDSWPFKISYFFHFHVTKNPVQYPAKLKSISLSNTLTHTPANIRMVQSLESSSRVGYSLKVMRHMPGNFRNSLTKRQVLQCIYLHWNSKMCHFDKNTVRFAHYFEALSVTTPDRWLTVYTLFTSSWRTSFAVR